MKEFLVFDGHCDTPMTLWEQRGELAENPGGTDLRRGRAFSGWAQFFAFCTCYAAGADRLPEEQILQDWYGYFMEQLGRSGLPVCTNSAELQQSLARHRVACMLSLEGAEAIGCDPGRLELLGQMGFSAVMPTWNRENALAGSHATGQGLTARGREFVRRAQKLGIMVDVSHLSDQGFWDLCRVAERPVIASHSNSRAVCAHSRNLTDDMFRALCEMGGVVGLNFYAPFLAEQSADFESIWRHLDHFLQCDGSDRHVGLGGDLDGCDVMARGMTGLESYPSLAEYLSAKGLSDESLRRIFWENMMGVYEVCTK